MTKTLERIILLHHIFQVSSDYAMADLEKLPLPTLREIHDKVTAGKEIKPSPFEG